MLSEKYQKYLYLLLVVSLLFNDLNAKSLGNYQSNEATHKRSKSKLQNAIF